MENISGLQKSKPELQPGKNLVHQRQPFSSQEKSLAVSAISRNRKESIQTGCDLIKSGPIGDFKFQRDGFCGNVALLTIRSHVSNQKTKGKPQSQESFVGF